MYLSTFALLLSLIGCGSSSPVDPPSDPLASAPDVARSRASPSAPRPALPVAPAPPGAPPVESPGQREAREVLEAHEAELARCAGAPSVACGLPLTPPWHPCDPPKATGLPASMVQHPAEHVGKYFFDGTACVEQRARYEPPCGFNRRCQPWTTREACEAARALCGDVTR